MKIPLHSIPESGLSISFDQNEKELEGKLDQPLSFEDFRGELKLFPVGPHFQLKGSFHGHVDLNCALCTKAFQQEVNESFNEILAPEWANKMRESNNMKDFFESEVELITGLYSDEFDLSEYLNELVGFSVPAYPKCKDDCKGLCMSCGADLNTNPCECSKNKQSGHIAFDSLKNLKIDSKH